MDHVKRSRFQLSRRSFVIAIGLAPVAAEAASDHLLFADDFRHGLDRWVVEAQGRAAITADRGELDIDSAEGVTLWFREALTAPVAIDFEVMAVSRGGANDAVSDVNAFWMASDPAAQDGSVLARRRSGRFEDYDLIRTYYVGIGGNRNTTTRMRRYIGAAGNRPILPEHDRSDAAALLTPNCWMHVRLTAGAWGAAVEREGRNLFILDDPEPYARGHFALRTTESHLRVRRFRISSPR
jgi:hypothetical protein